MKDTPECTQLHPWLVRHINLGFDTDDISALVGSIDSSQDRSLPSYIHLPAEILLHVLEFVPVDYILDWRRVCRGFRDAIDGRILYHHLHRTQLIGFMGPRELYPMRELTKEQYNRIRFLHARFQYIEKDPDTKSSNVSGCVWDSTHAVFKIDDSWFEAFRKVGGSAVSEDDLTHPDDAKWMPIFDTLEIRQVEDDFGKLTWAINLDHAVLDLDLPLGIGSNALGVDVRLEERIVRVAWKDMLFRFLKTETALRHMLDAKRDANFTFSHSEDCLREVRRQCLFLALNANDKVGRHHRWTLRNLPALFGKPIQHTIDLDLVESTAICTLLLLRREASMTSNQIAQLHQLSQDYQAMQKDLHNLDQEFKKFKSLLIPTSAFNFELPGHMGDNIPLDPIAWPDDTIATISERVRKWHNQKKIIQKVNELLSSSNQVLDVADDSFDHLSSQI
ncbi:hypothetical protein GQ44DRAFT_680500 [Phaeosphaeriaceae sp. PMI808]|nr:hypothetical protein GQ44DRAFT_680500 [Phaeosphaeriaceae sp. PMI808]